MRAIRFASALALFAAAGALNAGCAATAGGYVATETPAETPAPVYFSEPPTLVYVDSDVWVAQDSEYPVYYVDDSYWVYRDDVWYRSYSPYEGWTRIDIHVVPNTIRHRDQRRYVGYHGAPDAPKRVVPPRSALRPASLEHPPQRVQPAAPRRQAPPLAPAQPQQRLQQREWRGGAVSPRQPAAPPPRVRSPERSEAQPRRAEPPAGQRAPQMRPASRDEAPRAAPPERPAAEPRGRQVPAKQPRMQRQRIDQGKRATPGAERKRRKAE